MDELHSLKLSVNKGKINVSCACRARTGKHSKAGKITFDPIGPTVDFADSVRLYNDPENHWAPFEKKDEIGGKRKIQDRSTGGTEAEDV